MRGAAAAKRRSAWVGEHISVQWLRQDVVAGLTSAAVVVPKAMAYAAIAGLPVQVGLYTALLPVIIYALLGSSRPLSVTTTTTIAILAGSQLARAVPGADPALLLTASATLTLLVGGMLLLGSLLRFGFLANFISEPVLVGFKAGIGVVIVLDQLPKLLGVHVEGVSVLQKLAALWPVLPETSWLTLVMGLAMIVVLLVFEHRLPRWPAPLVVVASAIVVTALCGLQARGVELVGHIPQGMPSLILPDLQLVSILWPGALGIALMSFTETIAAGRAFTRQGERAPRANQELLATGAANLLGGLFGTMPAGGGTTQTAVNRLAGARSQTAQLVMALVALLSLWLLAPLLGLMPQVTLAAVVIVYSVSLIQPAEFAAIKRVRTMEFVWALVAGAGVVLLGTLKGILVAIVVSLLALVYQAGTPKLHVLGRKPGTHVFRPLSPEHSRDERFPGLLMLRVEGRVFFANADFIGEQIRALLLEHQPRVVALDLSYVPDVEYTALKMLIDGERRNRERGIELWLVGLNPEVADMVRRAGLADTMGKERLLLSLDMAVEKYLQRIAEEEDRQA